MLDKACEKKTSMRIGDYTIRPDEWEISDRWLVRKDRSKTNPSPMIPIEDLWKALQAYHRRYYLSYAPGWGNA